MYSTEKPLKTFIFHENVIRTSVLGDLIFLTTKIQLFAVSIESGIIKICTNSPNSYPISFAIDRLQFLKFSQSGHSARVILFRFKMSSGVLLKY